MSIADAIRTLPFTEHAAASHRMQLWALAAQLKAVRS